MKKKYIATICWTILMAAPTYLMSDDAISSKENSYILPSSATSAAPRTCNQNRSIQNTEPAPFIQTQQDVTPYKFTVGGQYSRVRQFAHNMSSYKGNLGGMFGEFEYKKRNSFYADATALWNWGTLYSDGNPNAGVKEGVWEGNLGGSYSWGHCNRWTIVAFTGFGYRRYVNDFDKTPILSACTIEYQTYFVPVGFKLNFDIATHWRASLNAKILPAVDEKLYVYTVTGTYWKQKRKPNFTVDLPITWSKDVVNCGFLEISATPFFRFWQLGSAPILEFPTWKQVYWGAQGTVGLTF